MMNELFQTVLIFKVLEMVQVLLVKIQRKEKLDWTAFMWALFTIGSACQRTIIDPTTTRIASSARSASSGGNMFASPPLFEIDEDSFESIFKSSDHELPSITEEEEEEESVDSSLLGSPSAVALEVDGEIRRHCKKQVSFSSANIYVFSMTVGDNPSVHSGPPVQLDWSPCERFENVPLEQVSKRIVISPSNYGNANNNAYPRRVLRIPSKQRRRILRENGWSESKIQKAEKRAAAAQKARQTTLANMDKQRYQERRESVKEFFCRSSRGVEMYEPFLSTPQDLSSTRNADQVCRACAKKCFDDNTKTCMSMYHCQGGASCRTAASMELVHSSLSSSSSLPPNLKGSALPRRLRKPFQPNKVTACTA
eukprot:CAMPEP_0172439190 /NCGR_PEP_ID=MMETSP1065-20121228/258_1 /TAXON_ID=265537 /ORGANISM="Amphiprora paludosa, Strain CCMP125" /LENGTH=366 /DNA_ID=CAMNT_0013187839 /DNA_START=175 /DNA_END=1275 /DNA_ORIENTATION=+